MFSAFKLNRQCDNIQPWYTPFSIWNQSIIPCLILIVASWPACRFHRRQVRWSAISTSWRIFHSLLWSTQSKGFSTVNETEVDVFLEFYCFFNVTTDVGNLISGSSAFSKSSLNLWNFSVHVLSKPVLEDFEDDHTSMWNEGNCAVVWTLWHCSSLGLEWKLIFSVPVATAEFSKEGVLEFGASLTGSTGVTSLVSFCFHVEPCNY